MNNITTKYDVIVVGAGPAGLALARELSDSNLSILLLDKKKNAHDTPYDTLGSYINIKKFKIPKEILNPINRVYFASENEHFTKESHPNIINRKKLLIFLEKEAKNNSQLIISYNSNVVDVGEYEGKITHIKYQIDGKIINAIAKIYIDCSGPRRILANSLNISAKFRSAVAIEYLVPIKKEIDTADIYIGKQLAGGYGWIFPLDNQKAIVGFGTLDKENIDKLEDKLRSMWTIKRVMEKCELKVLDKKRGVLISGLPPKQLVKGNAVIIGDAALQGNPLFGEGTRYIFDSAQIAAKSIKNALKNDNLLELRKYQHNWKKKYYKSYKLCYYLQKVYCYLSHNNKMCDRMVKKLNRLSDYKFDNFMKADISYISFIKLIFNTLW